jgi:hypothetical protein
VGLVPLAVARPDAAQGAVRHLKTGSSQSGPDGSAGVPGRLGPCATFACSLGAEVAGPSPSEPVKKNPLSPLNPRLKKEF